MASRTLSEADSKRLLASHGAIVSREETVRDADKAVDAAARIGYPVVVKLVGERLSHKSERGSCGCRCATPTPCTMPQCHSLLRRGQTMGR